MDGDMLIRCQFIGPDATSEELRLETNNESLRKHSQEVPIYLLDEFILIIRAREYCNLDWSDI